MARNPLSHPRCFLSGTSALWCGSVSVRGMATEKQVMMRINATKNISKITQSMKMVSAAKLRGDQARLDKAQPFNVSIVLRGCRSDAAGGNVCHSM